MSLSLKSFGAVGDGSADDTVAVTNWINSFPTSRFHAVAPAGSYRVTAALPAISARSRFVLSAPGARFEFEGTYAEGLRVVNCSNFAIRDLELTGPSTVPLGLHVTEASGSSEVGKVENVFTEGFTHGFGTGADTAGDVSEITYDNCDAANSASSGWVAGNGTPGNVLNIRAYGCTARSSQIGCLMQGGQMSWHSGSLISNSIADFKISGNPTSQPVVLSDIRSENSKRFLETSYGVFKLPLLLEGIIVASFTDAGGRVIEHNSYAPITLMACRFTGNTHGQPARITTGGDPNNKAKVVAINVFGDDTSLFVNDGTQTIETLGGGVV